MKHVHLIALAAAVAAGTSCGSAIRQGRSPVYLVVQSITALPGGLPGTVVTPGVLHSDVANVTTTPCSTTAPCALGDEGTVILTTALKDIGTPTSPTIETANNAVTITQYHVDYVRTDGRNTQGVDVPYSFDGATAGTIPAGGSQTFGFDLVRAVAKEEAPLIQLTGSSSVLTMIANITFYGHDQAGNDLNVTGSMTIEFGNFGG